MSEENKNTVTEEAVAEEQPKAEKKEKKSG